MNRDDLFAGPHGLRSGWRVFLFILLFAAFLWLTNSVWKLVFFHAFAPQGNRTITPWLLLIGASSSLVAILLALLVSARVEGVSPFVYGLPAKDAFRGRFWAGLSLGFLALSALLLLIRLMHGFDIGVIEGPPILEARYGFFYAIAFLMVGFFEELLVRSYILYTLTRGVGFWIAAVISSTIFALLHLGNAGEGAVGIFAVFCAGMLFCFFVWRTGNLWFAIGFHASWDWAQSYFYGVPDSGLAAAGSLFHSRFSGARWLSGGNVGPEGSYLVFAAFALCALLVHLAYPNASYPAEAIRAQYEASASRVSDLGNPG
ncbi:MAG: CPBP family intramembrane glutamic endopeptidase [Acidobacteriaceae bacterium]